MGSELSYESSHKLLDQYIEKGYYKLDTAQMYPVPGSQDHFCLTEKLLGDWVKKHTVNDQSKIRISTKFPNYSKRLTYLRKNKSNIISYQELKDSITSSLKRLNIPIIDIYYIHWPSRATNNFGKSFYESSGNETSICYELEETYSNLMMLKKEGLCRSIGVSNETSIALYSLKSATKESRDIDLYLQNSYNILNPTLDINITEFCLSTGIKIQAHSPLAFGVLTGKYQNNALPRDSRRKLYPNYFDRYLTPRSCFMISELDQLCSEFKINIIELSYRFLLNNPAVSEIVIGVKNRDQLDYAIHSIEKGKLPAEIYKSIQQLLQEHSITSW